ncbi:Hypothetical protein; putative membrane protein [Pseudomonas brassicacearum subsp. brassicacearum NFM421]|uniref:Uncharacterized protein n=1 Tax=Pseudomonas brassicacearum (strain NFM421) TaxID=994484 RepID=F2K8B9_PSEBN|nr:hypothetical protein [Pseudomonas brassicacearum]AEA67075.1 Hypothetical protein; putative membrane protein [Pseudomonas brassicacearum subsp. brassicacearum NFM421]
MQSGVKVEAHTMKLDYERPLIAYAYLAQSGAQDDILSGLIPLVTPIAKERAGKYFERDYLSGELKRLYGVDVHPWALDELVPRMEKAGVLKKTSEVKSGSLYTYATSLMNEFAATTEEDVQQILEDFIKFSSEIIEKSNIDVSEEILRKHFFNQIVTSDFQTRLIRPGQPVRENKNILQLRDKSPLEEEDEDLQGTGSQISETSLQKQLDQMKIICASYILHTSVNNQSVFKQLINIASGAILAEYILNLREPNSLITLSALRLYLDGPLAMSYLDLNEEKTSQYTLMLIESLRAKGASLYIFKEHVDEVRDNLRAALNQDGSGTRRPTYRRMQGPTFRTYAQGILSDLEGVLRRHQITIISTPKNPSYFNDELMESLTQALGQYAYHARERDAHAVGGVLRLRAGKINSRSYFHECQHIFITENKRVASTSFDFAIHNIGYKENYVPPAVTDRYLAGLMFVLYGGKTAKELTHKKLLANCASALEPNHALLSKVTTFLQDANEQRAGAFVEMMTSARSSQHRAIFLLDETRAISDMADAEQAFIDFEAEITESLSADFQIERDKIDKAYQAEIERLNSSKLVVEQQKEADALLFMEQAETDQTKLRDLEGALSEKVVDLNVLSQRLANQENESAERELNDFKDLLGESIDAADRYGKLLSRCCAVVGFIVAAVINYWSFDLFGNTQKTLFALLLVIVPITSSKLSAAAMISGLEQRRRHNFNLLLRKRANLSKAAGNYSFDFNRGEVRLLSSEDDNDFVTR